MKAGLGWPALPCRFCGIPTLTRIASTPSHFACAQDNPGGAPDRAVPAGVTNRRLP